MGFVSSIMTVFGEDMTHRSWLVFRKRIEMAILPPRNWNVGQYWWEYHEAAILVGGSVYMAGFCGPLKGMMIPISQNFKHGVCLKNWGLTRDTRDLNHWAIVMNHWICWDAKTSSMRQLGRLFALDPAKKIPSDSDPFVLYTQLMPRIFSIGIHIPCRHFLNNSCYFSRIQFQKTTS